MLNNSKARSGASSVPTFLRVFLAVFLLVVITSVLVTYILPETFEGTVRIKSEPPLPGTEAKRVLQAPDPFFTPTEAKVIQSEIVLTPVVEKLNLAAEWGKRYAGGAPLKPSDAIEFLRKSLQVRPVGKSAVIEIQVFSPKPEEAALIANAIAESYRDFRLKSNPEVGSNQPVDMQALVYPAPAILEHATPNANPVRPNKPLNIALGVIVGTVLGALVAGAVIGLRSATRKNRGGAKP